MTLQTPPRPQTPAQRAAPDASWPEPPRAYRPEGAGAARPRLVAAAEWVGAPGSAVPGHTPLVAPALSPGLARLLNAALIDSTFGEAVVESPIDAARRVTGAAGVAGDVFGTTLPDPALHLTLPALSESEWAVLAQMPCTASLAAAARELRRLCALVASAASAAIHTDTVAHTHLTEPAQRPLLQEVWSPASLEGALAGVA